jgi:hypothetical protein
MLLHFFIYYMFLVDYRSFVCPFKMFGVRVILKYLYPLLMLLFASAVVRDKEVFYKSTIIVRWVAIASLLISFIPFVENYLFPGLLAYGTSRAIHYISIMILSLALYYYCGRRKIDLILALVFLLPCIIWVYRTSMMGSIFALMIFFFFRYKLKSLPIILLIIALSVCAVFFIPSVRNKMFVDKGANVEQLQTGKIKQSDINSNARFAMWKYLTNKFYDNKELVGSGTGCVQNHMYTHHVFGGLRVPHGDFVQIKCDNGQIGLILYVSYCIKYLYS